MDMELVAVCLTLFIALPWLVLHYVTKWKQAPRLTDGDEQMLEDLYQLARRLDARMDTVERLAADSAGYDRAATGPRLIADNAGDGGNPLVDDFVADKATLAEIERKLMERTGR